MKAPSKGTKMKNRAKIVQNMQIWLIPIQLEAPFYHVQIDKLGILAFCLVSV